MLSKIMNEELESIMISNPNLYTAIEWAKNQDLLYACETGVDGDMEILMNDPIDAYTVCINAIKGSTHDREVILTNYAHFYNDTLLTEE